MRNDQPKRLATLTPREDSEWEKIFAFYVNTGMYTDDEADAATWREMQRRFPSLRPYDGCKP